LARTPTTAWVIQRNFTEIEICDNYSFAVYNNLLKS